MQKSGNEPHSHTAMNQNMFMICEMHSAYNSSANHVFKSDIVFHSSLGRHVGGRPRGCL